MPFDEKHHLFAVMNDPCKNNLCLIVMITTIYVNRHHDPACVFQGGEHNFINHRRYVLYRTASQVAASHVVKMLSSNYYVAKEDFEPSIFQQICNGFHISNDVKRWAVTYAKSVGV